VCKLYGKSCHKLTRQDDCVRDLQFGPCSFSCFMNWEVLSPRFRIACVSGWLYQILPFYERCQYPGIPLRTYMICEWDTRQLAIPQDQCLFCLVYIHSFIHSFQDHLYKNKSDHFLRIDLAAYSIYSACVLGKLKSCSGWSLAAVISVVIYGTKSMDGYLLMFLYN